MNAKPADIATGDAPRTKVAIVEDNATLRNYLAKLVSDAGYRCVCTEAVAKVMRSVANPSYLAKPLSSR